MKKTTNYGLNMPEENDFYNVGDMNANMEIIDREMKEAADVMQEEVSELKKSVSDGKSAVASAITDMGVSTESDATFAEMAENVGNITPEVSVSGSVSGSWDGAIFRFSGGAGGTVHINGNNEKPFATALSPKTTDVGGNAAASDVLSGKTFSSNNAGRVVNGTMVNNTNVRKTLTGSNNSTINGGLNISGSTMRVVSPTGFSDYNNTAWENGLQIGIGSAARSEVLAGKTFTSSAGLAVSGTLKPLVLKKIVNTSYSYQAFDNFAYNYQNNIALNTALTANDAICLLFIPSDTLHMEILIINKGDVIEKANWRFTVTDNNVNFNYRGTSSNAWIQIMAYGIYYNYSDWAI